MRKFQSSSVKALAFSASAIAFAIAGPAYAQDAEDGQEEEEEVDVTEDGETAAAPQGGIVVTGSRIRRDTYTSISPIQVLSTEQSQEVGLFDPTQILQRSESASGTQIDATFQGFVLDNGPGSATLNLRGLGADRTLLLVNGRRLAPAGAEGAPANPSINLLPSSLIDRYDLLLDGASSVYGSDAVAGVGNIILRKDFDGLELFARGELNPDGAGEDYTISASYGWNFDRGFIGFGAEYDYRDEVRLKDRDFFQGCSTHLELGSDGVVRTSNIGDDADIRARTNGAIGLVPDDCVQFVGANAVLIDDTYSFSLFKQPGPDFFGIPGGWTDTTNGAFGGDLDLDGDGFRDVDFRNNNLDGLNPEQTFLSEQKLYNVMSYGEYTFPGAGNITAFFEANYTRAEISSENTGISQLTPVIPANNPFNPCNPNAVDGVDCGILDNVFTGVDTFAGGAFANTPGARAVRPFFGIRGDRDNFKVTQEQYRGVLGLKGDLPAFGSSWTWEVSGVYSRSEGKSSRVGVRNDRLALALGYDPSIVSELRAFGQPTLPGGPCDVANISDPSAIQPDVTAGCVAVDLFADSIFEIPFGSFATQAERDYLLDERNFDTTYEQYFGSAFVQGDIFDLPAGSVSAVFGGEWRKDRIDSRPDAVASEGLFFGFFSDGGATGSKVIRELFAEVDIPLIAAQPLVEELNLNIAGRLTDEEFYGTNYTYSMKAGWRPIPSLLLRMTYGTSFRAPNLRENFLAGQSGFLFLNDPCAVPDAAFSALGGGYDASLDTRDAAILANCTREGRDPTRVGISPQGTNTDQAQSVEITTGGSLDINPETSRSITAGFSFEETFGDGFDVALGVNYYDIKLKDSIVEPSSQFIVNDCFLRQDGQRSPFCDRLAYDTDGANTRLLVSDINSGFINLNQESVRGWDFNATFGKDVQMFGTNVDFGINLRANHLVERSTLFIDDLGEASFDDDAGEFGLPKWTGTGTFTADIDDIRLTWQVRYTGRVEQDETGIDPFTDAFGFDANGEFQGFFGDTCLGNGSANGVVAGDGIFCRDVGFAKEIFYHAASVRYAADKWTLIVGVDNIFNTAPPLVDPNEVPLSISNTAIGNGYDYDGREFFASIRYEF